MFKGLLGGGRSSSSTDLRSNSSSKGERRRKSGHRSSASSTVSHKSSRGDDRDRGLGDLSAYSSPGSASRSKRYAESAAGESVASSYATAQPNYSDDRIVSERALKRSKDSEYDDRDDRDRDHYREDRTRDKDRQRRRTRSEREYEGERDRDDRDNRRRERERERTHSGDDAHFPPVASGAVPAPFDQAQDPSQPSAPENHKPQSAPGNVDSPTIYDPHVQQQFPGQFPTTFAEPYRPPNPAGEAADYYGDQGQSVQDQPGVRPKPPLVIPNSQAHLMTASPSANPPPEPSSVGEVGAAASYFAADPGLDAHTSEQPISGPQAKPPKPSKPSKPSHSAGQAAAAAAAGGAATYGLGDYSAEQVLSESPTAYATPTTTNQGKPPHSNSHGVGAAVGGVAAGAAAGYMLSHHHHSSSSASDHVSQYSMQNPDDTSQIGQGYSGAPMNPALYGVGAAGAAGAAYAASPLHPHHAAIYHGSPFQGGAMAYQQRQRGPFDKFIDFWRDPEGVGKFEDYTEEIGVCRYCFEPGSTSRNAPRPHNYGRRRSSDRISSGSRVDKLSRYGSSEDEGRRRKSSKSSWLPAILGGYAMKSLFDNKDFDDSYSVKSGQVSGAYPDSDSSASDKKSRTSRGVYKRSHRTRSQEPAGRADYYDSKPSGYEGSRIAARPRSRSRSSSRSNRHSHTLRDAAIGAAVGGAAMSMAKSHHRDRSRSNSPSRSVRKPRGRRRKSSSSSGSSFDNISRPAKNSAGGFGSFFTASSDNRNKRRNKRSKSIFSFNNSSSSSLDNDLAFGSGYAKKLIGKSKRRNSKEKKNKDVDAKLLALGATATALAASSPRRNRRTGEVFVGQGSRSGRSDYTSSASNDEDWEDLDSEGQASSVSSALAFGASASGNSSDSSSSGWGWVWGGKNKKKSKKHSGSNEKHFPTGAAAAVAAGALGTAALGSGYHRDNKAPSQAPSSSTASLQHVAPIPTSDPGRYDAAPLSSFPPSQPQLIRPGSIPLQQPQPVTPVSQAVYTTQGAPIHSYSAPVIPAFESPFPSYESQLREVEERQEDRGSSRYPQPLNELPRAERRHRRSDSTPIFQSDPIEPAPGSGLKRRSTTRDQASVSFNLTDEQEDKQRRTEHLERLKNDLGRRDRIELLDYEEDTKSAPAGYASKRYRDTEPERERERERDRDREFDRERERESESRFTKDDLKRDRDTGERWRERSEQRRAERRRATDPSAMSSASSDIPERPKPREVVEERASSASPSDHVKTSAFRGVRNKKAVYDDYAAFFYPDELRYSPDSQSRRESPTMPTIVEIEPASESSREKPQEPPFDSSFEPTPDYRGFKNLPWPVPSLRVIEPTPPHSVSGSVRGTSSPIITPAEPVQVEEEPERPTGSRVSWADEDRRHEYEVPSTSSERSSIDLNERQRDSIPDATTTRDGPIDYTYIEPSHAHVEDTNDEIEFAATVAAATQAAGFDPSLVTDDPVFRTRTSPPGSDTRERSISPTTRVPAHPEQFHGYVEGEVETPEAAKPKSQFFSDETIFPGPKPTFSNSWAERGWDYGSQPSAEQPVVEHIDRVETDPADVPLPRSVIETSDIQEKPTGRYPRQESDSPGEEEFFMPGGFEPEESAKPKRRSPSPTTDAIPQSTVSYSDTREFGPEPLRRTETEGTETDQNDVAESVVGTEDGTEGKKKKRRKRRSKRESDTFDDTASVASSVATESSDKRRSMEDKGKKSGGFLSSIFGSRVSEPVESKRSPEKPVSREVQSEIGTRTFDDSSRRRRHRSSSRGDSLDGRRRYDDRELDREDNFLADKDVNVESYKSSRQRREDKRKQLYGDSEYEKV
ncbi:hypothetical protein ASPVEDRAFT_130080 [Aspergillus versicolor CBS 583.65]|uniref:Involucrin repeat protein n=1 Tax=Aspergillus versicolor CBS 583.65 TaxID=1036611 RepID=A0A1L9PHR7_ASPVE|nr:uncharacterized protein ASPVEDRAFT_130080 [Aspergillus versicolor CBS 583.65]OJJ01052.1 hypothetical protein ASPVEDRAFT_130080 [Aspergillus versicolor CBS 583.65]